ncbi:MAG: hypothetical protein LC729_02770 [Acidobacteria bacterium]|nr:hypothetical protein [Acidobacteriota bacterium]
MRTTRAVDDGAPRHPPKIISRTEARVEFSSSEVVRLTPEVKALLRHPNSGRVLALVVEEPARSGDNIREKGEHP